MHFYLLQRYGGKGSSGNDWIETVFFIVLGIMILAALKKKPITDVLSHWHHRFETIQFSPEEFYTLLESVMEQKEIKKLNIVPINYSQGGWLSPKRKYLRVQYGQLVFDICAAPFAKEFFVSWWFGELSTPWEDFVRAFPIFGKYLKTKKREKSFYELDTDTMFKESVSICVKETIEQLTQIKGMRKLSEGEWKEYNSQY